ncbi:MAG: hypothetical protein ACO1NY_08005 [Pseudorhodoplanes sp.]
MIKLPAGLHFQNVPRVATYAAIAALVTGALFAVDSVYRWYDENAQVLAPTRDRSVAATKPAPAEAAAPAQGPAAASAGTGMAEKRSEEGPVTAQTPNPVGSTTAGPKGPSALEPAVAAAPGNSASNAVIGVAPKETARSADVAPHTAQPALPPIRPELSTPPARQVTREPTAPRRPVQAAEKPPVRTEKPAKQRSEQRAEQPNVYWEQDGGSQLGFAPQLRKKTCDPATGQMPMQCYYPREGRERFPARPAN